MPTLEDIIDKPDILKRFLIGISETVKKTYAAAYEEARPKKEFTQIEDDNVHPFFRKSRPKVYGGLSERDFEQLTNPDDLQLPTTPEEILYQFYRTGRGGNLSYKPLHNLPIYVKVFNSLNVKVHFKSPFKVSSDKNKEWAQNLRKSLSEDIINFVRGFKVTDGYQDNESADHHTEEEQNITKIIHYSGSTPEGLLKPGTLILGFSPEDVKETDGKHKKYGPFCLSMGKKCVILEQKPDAQNPSVLITGGISYFIRKGKPYSG